LTSVVPIHVTKSQELISHDIHTSVKQYKFSYSVEIVPLCKDDMLALPIKLAKSIGNIPPLALVYKIGTAINVLDPTTLQTASISTKEYWHTPFSYLANVQDMTEFIVLDIEPLGPQKGNFVLAEATVSLASDMDSTYYCRTHLGGILHPGDSVMGYHLTGSNFNNDQFDAIQQNSRLGSTIPDVLLVKKLYARKKKASGKAARNWKLKRLAREESEMAPRKQDQERLERDFEMFLRDVEEDKELRAGVNVYKALQQKQADAMDVEESDVEGSEDEEVRIPMEQLLEDLEELGLEDTGEEVG